MTEPDPQPPPVISIDKRAPRAWGITLLNSAIALLGAALSEEHAFESFVIIMLVAILFESAMGRVAK